MKIPVPNLDRLNSTGSQAIRGRAVPVVPDRALGFALRTFVTYYPPDAPTSHRRAVYCEAVPIEPAAKALMEHWGRDKVLGMVPVTPEAAEELRQQPMGPLAEALGNEAVAATLCEIRRKGG